MASVLKKASGGAAERQSTRRYDPAETRTRILEAAHRLFAVQGYDKTGTAEIAAKADVSEGSIFYHFGSKRALMVELGRLHGQRVNAAMQGDDPLHSLNYYKTLNRLFDFSESQEEIKQAWAPAHEAHFSRMDTNAQPFFAAAREVIQDWMRQRMEAVAEVHGPYPMDVDIASDLIFVLVGEALNRYFREGTTAEERRRIRVELVRFCTAASGHPAVDHTLSAIVEKD